MAVDSSNIIRVDLQDVFTACERQTAHRSEAIDGGVTINIVAVNPNDYNDLFPFIMEGANRIANSANYITSANETGLDALTRIATDSEDLELKDVLEKTKLTGESMDPDLKDLIIFGIEELSSQNRYTIVQGFILEAMTHYALYKWYHMKRMFEDRDQEEFMYKKALQLVQFNSVTNTKRKKVRRPTLLY